MKFFSKGIVVNNVISLSINSIVANPNQPRVIFLKQDLKDLADSIKMNGILQPLIVRLNDENKYELSLKKLPVLKGLKSETSHGNKKQLSENT